MGAQRGGGRKGGGPNPEKVGAEGVGGPNPEKVGPRRVGPEGWEAQNFALFLLSPTGIFVSLWESAR